MFRTTKSLILSVILLSIISCSSPTPSFLVSSLRRDVGEASLSFYESWRTKVEFIVNNGNNNLIHYSSNGILFDTQNKLGLINSKTGKLIWQIEHAPSPQALISDNESAYLFSGWQLGAYDLENGRQKWQTSKFTSHTIYNLTLQDDYLTLYGTTVGGKQQICKIDTETGKIIDKYIYSFDIENGEMYLDQFMQKLKLYRSKEGFQAVDIASGDILWQYPLKEVRYKLVEPVEIEDYLIFSVQPVIEDLVVLDFHTGKIIWQTSNVVSNAVVMDGIVYVISTDGSIEGYEIATGNNIGRIILYPSATNNTSNYMLLVDPTTKMLYAYYGDSGEIIAFQFTR